MFKKDLNPELEYERKVFICMSKIPLDYSDIVCD